MERDGDQRRSKSQERRQINMNNTSKVFMAWSTMPSLEGTAFTLHTMKKELKNFLDNGCFLAINTNW